MKLGLPLAAREKELADLKTSASKRTFDVHFQGRMRTYPVYPIRIELPKYRLENGRTSAAQQDYIAKNKLPKNFFDPSRSENSEVQRAQHAILKAMVESQDPEKNLMKFFKKREQEQPLILDQAGFVVNGNRRLCAYREINENVDKTKFGHIDIIILPKCDPKDIDELEAHLQVERDIKQDYGWISLTLTLRQKLDSGQYTEDQLCSIYDLDRRQLQLMITQLTLAEEYLASRKKEGLYLELEKTQLAFDQLQKNRTKLADSPGKQQLFSEVAFRLIESPEGDRLYASIPDAKDVLDEICTTLQTELLGPKIAVHQKQIEKAQTTDLFGKTQPGAAQESKYLATFKALRESKEQQAIQAIIQNAIAAKKERDRAIRRGNSALEAIRKANTAIADAVSLLYAQTSKTGIQEQIQAIEQSIEKIKKWLKH
jgi:hypothetical protein